VAVTNAAGQVGVAAALGKLPVWMIPTIGWDWEWKSGAVGLAEDAAVVPVPEPGVDHGATVHLLGATVFFQKLSSASFPYVAAFQGDGYAVAAVAGQSAGTPLDGMYPALTKSHTTVDAVEDGGKPAYPNLEVADEPGTMRVVDGAGAAVDCRKDDTVYVPAGDRVVYVLAGGSAEDLMSVLRVAVGNRLPVADAVMVKGESGVTVRVKNITGDELRGKVRVLVAGARMQDKAAVTEKSFAGLAAQGVVEVPVDVSKEVKWMGVEVETGGAHGVMQKTLVEGE